MKILILKIILFSAGLKYLDMCPLQPRIPTYLFVGGTIGGVTVLHLLWKTRFFKKLQHEDELLDFTNAKSKTVSNTEEAKGFIRMLDCGLLLGGLIWFILGNIWLFSIYDEVHYSEHFLKPHRWCHKTVFLFALFQILQLHVIFGILAFLLLILLIAYVRIKLSL